MLAGTSTAAVVGLAASFIGASIWGTAGLPFIIGSSIGFVLGSTKWYFAAEQEALLQLDKYPSILRLHLVSNFPWKPELGRRSIEWFTATRFSANWQMKSMLIAAWLTAQPALDEIRNRSEAELVEAYSRQRVSQRQSLVQSDEDNGDDDVLSR
ncbi:hypothetical protein CkaCkLH20_05997 [Colletotrichum karsti]|uniref:Uncharacterized protein n=1 Tax=Colletotrichum karsti TaxID=1095194 RepID=A0A9P6I5G0_9PEZI|nr:uncharacterized protein CkaCkLH20_05997 [Colletotrichum karsti]KAF9876589.1 hypothetical protein CkaCkLH20_05997 [Colletotrichum karsti]